MELRLFGGVRGVRECTEVALGGPRQRFVLAILAMECGHVVSSDRLVEILWPESGEKKLASLHVHISNLRRALDPLHGTARRSSVLVRQPPGYRLDIDRGDVDVLRFEDLVVSGRRHLAEHREQAALESFSAAIDLWVAPPVPELANEPVAVAAVARWHGLLGVALSSAASLHLAADDAVTALLVLEQRLADFQADERMHALAALAMYRVGRQTDALRLIEQTRSALLDTAGLDLGAELVSLERSILVQDPSLRPPPSPATRRALSRGASASASSAIEPAGSPADETQQQPTHPLIGRDAPLSVLRAAVAATRAGRGGSVHITGRPGIGKTALVEAVTDEAAAAGVVTAWGRCAQPAGAPAFWPIIEIERQLVESGVLADDARLVDVASIADHFLVAERMADLLVQSGRTMVLVIDDLHAADDDSLRVLVHLFSRLRRTNVLFVVTAHPLTGAPGQHLLECVAELARQRVAEISLHELTEADVALWTSRRFGRAVRDDVVSDIHERTLGHPLFLRELLALVEPNGDVDDGAVRARLSVVPNSLLAVVRRRVSALGASTQRLLTMVAVLGPSFDVATAADVAGIAPELALEQLSAALDAGLVVAAARVGSFRFTHGVVAEALSTELNDIRRAGVHAAAARSLARRRPDDANSAAVALHAAAGALAGTAPLAVEASRRAALFAQAHGAHADAARHWAVVASMSELSAPDDQRSRLEALINAAQAHERADEMPQAQAIVVTALSLARSHGDPALIEAAASALNHASIFPNLIYGAMNATLISLLGECLRLLPDASSARATVLAALSTELFHSADVEWRDEASSQAVAIARELGEPAVLVRALHARTFALKQPASVPARREIGLEIAEIARRSRGGDDIVLVGELQTALADFTLGDLPAAQARLGACRTLLDRPVGQALRSQVAYFGTHLDIIHGRRDEARQGIDDAFEMTRRSRPTEAAVIRLGQLLTLGLDDGDLPDALFVAARTDDVEGYALVVRLLTAVVLFDLGRPDEAHQRVPYRRGEVPVRPLDYTTTFVDTAAAFVAAETGDRVGAAALLERLTPMVGRWVAPGTGAGSLGLVDLALARLHATLENTNEARHWFRSAVEGHDRLDVPAWLARSLLHQGRFLLRSGDSADGTAALRRASELAREHGLPIVLERIDAT